MCPDYYKEVISGDYVFVVIVADYEHVVKRAVTDHTHCHCERSEAIHYAA